jgi:adhesin transport system outer membrane protein
MSGKGAFMKRPRQLTAIMAGLLLLASGSAQAESLSEAVQEALATNPVVKAEFHDLLARRQEVVQAKSGYLPRLDYMEAIGVEENYNPDSSSTPREHVLSLRQNLFQGFATDNEVKRQQSRVDSATYRLHAMAEGTALKTAKAYLDVLRHLELQMLASENLTIHEQIFDQVKLRSESGVGKRANQTHVQGRLALAKSNAVVTEINLLDAKTNYQAVVGHFPDKLTQPRSFAKYLPATVEEAQKLAVDAHPTLMSAQADLVARKAQDEVAKSAFWPVVDVEVDKRWRDEFDDRDYWEDDLAATLRVRFNLYHGGRDKARKMETTELLGEARQIRNQTHRQVVESIRLSWMANKAVQDKLKHLNDYIDATSATAEAFTKQWNIGKRTMLDVLDTKAEVVNARKDYIEAKYDGLYAEFRVLSGMGRLVHTLDLKWPDEQAEAEKQEKGSSEKDSGSENKSS